MKEEIQLNTIISTSSSNNISEPLLNYNNISQNITNKNIILNVKQRKLVPMNVTFFTFKGKELRKMEDRIICFSKRRKMPKKIGYLGGYFMTVFLFLFFTLLMTICLCCSKNIPDMSDSIKKLYNYFLFFMWLSTIITVLSLTDASSADPGRQRGTPIPRNKYDLGKIKKIVGGNKYSLKYCSTCNLIRDVRTFHCDRCGICIEKHDHHCGYLSNCVGVYNYKKFFLFIIIGFIHISLMEVISIHYIAKFSGKGNTKYEWITIFVIIILLFATVFGFFIFWMIMQHIITIVKNKTTREFIKNKEYKVYDRGCTNNCKEALCRNSIKEL